MDGFIKDGALLVIGAAITAVGFLYKEHRAKRNDRAARKNTADQRALAAMQLILPEEFVRDLRNLEPYSGFPKSVSTRLEEFYSGYKGKRAVFHDKVLNASLQDCVTHAEQLYEEILSFCMSDGERLATRTRNASAEQRQRQAEEAKQIWTSAQALREAIIGLYDEAKGRLII